MNSFASFWTAQFDSLRLKGLDKRHVKLVDLEPIIQNLPKSIEVSTIGNSFEGRFLYKLALGNGSKNVLAWACMHGNESTSLRGWMDWIVAEANGNSGVHFTELLKEYTIHFIPMLNPDGAELFTRRNAMGIDMNRDARAQKSPEIKALAAQIKNLDPVLAFNLHDQRNVFTAGGEPATLSFLAPSIDKERSIPFARALTMDLIAAAVSELKPLLKGGIGRYSDEFYPTAIGEYTQERGIPTILVECGAGKTDPLRQEPRMLNAVILHSVLSRISTNTQPEIKAYQAIPVNESNQFDVLIKNVKFQVNNEEFTADISLLEELNLEGDSIVSMFKIADFGDLRHFYALENCSFQSGTQVSLIASGSLAHFRMQTDAGEIHFENGIKIKAPF